MQSWIIKLISIFIMFIMIFITGNIPLRLKSYKENTRLISILSAFTGGLFLSIGIFYLIPESQVFYLDFYQQQIEIFMKYYPWSFFIIVTTFSLLLFLDKVLTIVASQQNNKGQKYTYNGNFENDVNQEQQNFENKMTNNNGQINQQQNNQNTNKNIVETTQQQEVFSQKQNMDQNIEQKIIQEIKKQDSQKNFKPYLLQIAFGITAILEGLAIGLEKDWVKCLILAAAVLCHKCTEILTFANSLKKANINLKVATIMVIIQAIINIIGIGIGWGVSNQGYLEMCIYTSITSGAFIYVATLEILVDEFSNKGSKILKFLFFIIAIVIVSVLWFFEEEVMPNY
ncbi:zip zinc transporter family protein, putative [Ichthyophthirius multifiliis]|uniref:Zip zinc transporter family protein, putative n=1 Tax=Ichthyophthirius multifiliis TaxID=5932 RepID=G0QQP3_ICHMU|nr:zip zinc transporter family protein, putative [Ichthyophthirius multifiliis]EGR32461.1 zip zinc transporter family protein, putative [Ichthyophthirius multifiliis]|eukprot:XP_004036447.1 zip zinc transporter family protein, putative [Ichthyophthirius multifiliis]